MTNRTRLAELIESEVPKKYRASFNRFLDTSKDDDLIGTVADLVAGGAIAAALDTIADSRLAALSVAIGRHIRAAFVTYVRVMRSDAVLKQVRLLLANNQIDAVVYMVGAEISKVTETIPESYAAAGKAISGDINAALKGKPSKAVVTFGNVSERVREAETSATNAIYSVTRAAEQTRAVEEQVRLARDATYQAKVEARAARDAADRAMKSIRAVQASASRLKDVSGDVGNAISETAKRAIQASEDATKLADKARTMSFSSPTDASEAARQAAQAAAEAERAADATRAAALQVEEVARGIRPSVGVTFDPGNPVAAREATELTYEFIREVSEAQREDVRRAVTDALSQGKGPKEAARAFRDTIGLTAKQKEAVENYRRLLESGSKDALTRALADKRTKKIDALSSEQIDKLVDRYRERYINYRADTIAITEAGRAMGAANHEAFRQTIEAADIDPADVGKSWNATHDGRTRASHWFMDKQTVTGLDALFTSGLNNKLMYPGDRKAPPADTVRCRCVCTYRLMI